MMDHAFVYLISAAKADDFSFLNKNRNVKDRNCQALRTALKYSSSRIVIHSLIKRCSAGSIQKNEDILFGLILKNAGIGAVNLFLKMSNYNGTFEKYIHQMEIIIKIPDRKIRHELFDIMCDEILYDLY